MTSGQDRTVPALVEVEPGTITRLTLNRPEARNALSGALIEAVSGALAASAADEFCRVVVVAGRGKDFCAGADVKELAEARHDPTAATGYGHRFEAMLGAVEAHPRPVVASVHGAAFGGGCQLASACDLVVAEDEARFAIPSGRLGVVISYESVQRLVAAVGLKRANDLLLAGRIITGVEAVDWGLAALSVDPDALASATTEVAERIAELAPLSVAASKRGLRAAARLGEAGREGFERLATEAMASEDVLEGLAALRERRRPAFQGR